MKMRSDQLFTRCTQTSSTNGISSRTCKYHHTMKDSAAGLRFTAVLDVCICASFSSLQTFWIVPFIVFLAPRPQSSPFNLLSEDFIAGYMDEGRMSVVRRFFCLFVTFDVVFISLLWIICVMVRTSDLTHFVWILDCFLFADHRWQHYACPANPSHPLYHLHLIIRCRYISLVEVYISTTILRIMSHESLDCDRGRCDGSEPRVIVFIFRSIFSFYYSFLPPGRVLF